MPFTFAHPAIVINQKNNKYFDFTTLVIGTMAPDFEYFINFRPISTVGHTLLGQIYFNMPLVLLIAYVYHTFLKIALIENLPNSLKLKYYYLSKSKWSINSFRRFIILVYSAILGAFTHIFWDSFTHENGYFVDRIDILSLKLSFANYNLPIYKILQHASTLIGFFIIFIFLIRLIDKDYKKNNLDSSTHFITYKDEISVSSKFKFWLLSFTFSALIFFSVLMSMEKIYIASVIISFINSILIAFFISSIIYKLKQTKK